MRRQKTNEARCGLPLHCHSHPPLPQLFFNSSKKSQPPPSPGSTLRTSTCLIRPLEGQLWRRLMEETHKANQGNMEREEGLLSKIDELPNLFSGEIEGPEEYFNAEGMLNITKRLEILFPLLDSSPEDGVLSFKELEAWNVRQAMERLIYMTKIEMLESDGIRSLNFTEYKDSLHQEESETEKIQLWLLKEKIRGKDYDKDGKLNLTEFRDFVSETQRIYNELESGEDDMQNIEENFAELDLNMDKFLTIAELRRIFHHFNPAELSYAKQYTKYILNEVDQDKDGKLTQKEMLAYPHVFYSTVLTEGEFANDHEFHEEL
ncbi:hypothetical protein Syun_013439 [Stephania yunnanensis]|uniref:EF-hand domain-containing protein n=1 Tax=Stephania yunnanensis TaxID=152371 RepID=A0AAP0PIL2_9MAGN